MNEYLNCIGPFPLRDEYCNNIDQTAHERKEQNNEYPKKGFAGADNMNRQHDLQEDRANCNKNGHFV